MERTRSAAVAVVVVAAAVGAGDQKGCSSGIGAAYDG